jgi:uncharacterized protein YegJ (DUF2314 family)
VAAVDTKSVPSDDLQMIAAIKKARSTLQQFFKALAHPKLSQNSFLVRVAFLEGEEVEHIWIADLDLSGKTPQGVIAEKPGIVRLRFMQWVSFDPDDITDWMYIEDGRLVGGYTTRLLRERMSPEERRQLDASAPYRFPTSTK